MKNSRRKFIKESVTSAAGLIALSTLPNFKLPGDVSASKRYWAEDIIEPEIEVSSKGTIAVSNEAGLGYEIKTDLIDKLTVRKETLRSRAATA